MINSEDLRFFDVIANHSSLAASARALNVTPPTVTQRLQLIEKKLQLKLVQRHAKSISLTDEGLLLAQRAQGILEDMQNLHELLANQRDQISGRLKLLAPLGFGSAYVAPLVSQFQRQYPDVTVELELSDNPDWGAGQSWDIMIYIGALRDSSLRLVVLAPNQRFLCASPDYLKHRSAPQCAEDLRDHACIALRENAEDVTLWKFHLNRQHHAGAIRITPTLACNDGRVIKQWALDGRGIILRSQWDLMPELKSGQLVRLLPDHTFPSADIVALLGTDQRARSARTTKFLELLKSQLGAQPWNK